MDIKYVKLLTGEDLVSEVVDSSGESFKLKNPVRLIVTQEGLGMGPLTPFSKGVEVEIRKEHVIFVDDPEEEIRNAYNSQFGSGIVTAGAGALHGIDIVS